MSNRRGSTLIELIISIVLLAGILVIVINFFFAAKDFSTEEAQRVDVGETAARAFATLDETLREGRSIVASGVVGGVTYTTSDTTVVLQLPSIVNGILTSDNDTVVVMRDASTNILERKTEPHAGSSRTAGTVQLATGVSDLFFRYTTDDPISSTAVTAVISSTRTVRNKPYTKTTLVYETLRNHP